MKEVIKHLLWDESTLTDFYGKVSLEPLQRGIGTTIGNSLRRMLLSYIPGAAPVAMRVDGVWHEFSTLPFIKEDIQQLCLNIRKLVVKLPQYMDKAILKLNAESPGEVYAGSIETPHEVEIINKNLHIATLSYAEKGKLKLEIEVKRGYGWLPAAEQAKGADAPEGTIFLDALFSPILKVTYDIEELKGKWLDYEKLVLEVWTNGSVSPKFAVEEAANLLIKELLIFSSEELRESYRRKEEEMAKEEEKEKLKKLLESPLEELDLSVRAMNSLQAVGIDKFNKLVFFNESELLRLKHLGRKSLAEIKDKLAAKDLKLGMKEEVKELFPTLEVVIPPKVSVKKPPKVEEELPILPVEEKIEEEIEEKREIEGEIEEEEEIEEEGKIEEEIEEEGEIEDVSQKEEEIE